MEEAAPGLSKIAVGAYYAVARYIADGSNDAAPMSGAGTIPFAPVTDHDDRSEALFGELLMTDVRDTSSVYWQCEQCEKVRAKT